MSYPRSDEEVLRHAIGQVIVIDMTQQHGALEGTSYYIPGTRSDRDEKAGANLVKRGILRQDNGRLYLTESALMRILNVAIESTLADLMVDDPPEAKLPEIPDYEEEDGYLCEVRGEIVYRSW